jgi:beta-lactamase superfamily II metal-dependent hydrolase
MLAVVSLSIALLTCPQAFAQQVLVLALSGDGSATVTVDPASGVAYLTDGGRAGTRGVRGATIEGKDVLQFFKEHQPPIRELVITCSHPHADHMNGLIDFVTSDPGILSFSAIRFIDAFEQGKAKPLYDHFVEKWGEQANVAYSSAFHRNAFQDLPRNDGSPVRVSNFQYDPKEVGDNEHDRSVIVKYEIRGEGGTVAVVDPDDASAALIKRWLTTEKADVMLASHHGSRNNANIDIIDSARSIGLKAIIFTSNDANPFSHPAPEVLQHAIRVLGAGNVYVTGSMKGDNVAVIPPNIVVGDGRPAGERLASFISGQIERSRARMQNILEPYSSASGAASIQALLAAAGEQKGVLNGKDRAGLVEALAAAGMDRQDAERLVRLVSVHRVHRETLAEMSGRDESRDAWLATLSRVSGPPSKGGFPPFRPSTGSGDNGTRSHEARDGATRTKLPPSAPPPVGGGTSGPRPIGPTGTPGERAGATRDARTGGNASAYFLAMLATMRPAWGGVILGNDVKGPKIKSIGFECIEDEPSDGTERCDEVAIRLELRDGTVARYWDTSPALLWSAYHFVQPGSGLSYDSGLTPALDAAGVIGKEGEEKCAGPERCWTFAIHPAIADTYLVRKAMQLDMSLSAAVSAPKVPKFIQDAGWPRARFSTYQWYDAEAEVVAKDGVIRVQPRTDPKQCLMRVRLIFTDLASAFSDAAFTFRLDLALDPLFKDPEDVRRTQRLRNQLRGPPSGRPTRLSALEKKRLARLNAAFLDAQKELLKNVGTHTSQDLSLNRTISEPCKRFDPLRSLDRLARVVAVLRFAREALGRDLPPLPKGVSSVRMPTAASARPSDVWASP